MNNSRFLLAVGFLSLVSATARAATYSEAVDGDISNNRNAPTTFALSAATGGNSLTATTGGGTNDEEYLKVVVPAMFNLASITLNSYSGAAKSFIGIQAGSTFTVTPAAATAADMLGYTLFGATGNVTVGGNVLAAMSQGAGSVMFTPPLAANTYTIWIQETGNNVTYTMTFNVQANASVQAPVIDPPGNSFFDSVEVTLTTATAGADIYYTLDGSTPTTASTLYTGPFMLTSSATVKAFGRDGSHTDSLVASEDFLISPTPVVPAPTLVILGKKSLKTDKTSVKIKGTAANATTVEYRVGTKGVFKPASGAAAWSINAKLKPGKNLIAIQAKGPGGISEQATVTVTVK